MSGKRSITLTPREQQVLDLTAQGYGKSYIARNLQIGQERVETIRDQIKEKLELPKGKTVDDMVAAARARGLTSH